MRSRRASLAREEVGKVVTMAATYVPTQVDLGATTPFYLLKRSPASEMLGRRKNLRLSLPDMARYSDKKSPEALDDARVEEEVANDVASILLFVLIFSARYTTQQSCQACDKSKIP